MKVLIISHTCLNTHNNMGRTLLSLFSEFKESELCQLYLYPMLPDIDVCSSYYRITDKEVLKGCIKRKVNGREISKKDIDISTHKLFENKDDEKLYRNKKNKSSLRVLLRDLMWKLSPWYNKDLVSWIEREKPTCIFVAPGIPKLLYDIALKIAHNFRLPIITYICDDFYFLTAQESFLDKLRQKLMMKKVDKLMEKSSHIVSICDEISEKYGKQFNIPTTTIMTGSGYEIESAPSVVKNPKVLNYMGNINYNRFLSLAEIGKALDELNEEHNENYRLDIYTIEKDEKILASFNEIKSIRLCGFVGGSEFVELFKQSQILVHTESFDEYYVEFTKNSISTKIADCLASGIPLFAYGPEQLASMGHLIRNDCAVVATEKAQLKDTLYRVFNDAELREEKALKGLDVAKRCHSAKTQSEKLKLIIKEEAK